MKSRKRNRLKGYDYSQAGGYFVTICTKDRIPWFGEIINGEMHLSKAGKRAQECWQNIPNHFPCAYLDQFIIMPDHIHGIIFINDPVGDEYFRPLNNIRADNHRPQTGIIFINDIVGGEDLRPINKTTKRADNHRPQQKQLPSIIRGFKIGVTKWCHQNNHLGFAWQRSFHDHIIRNEKSLERIRHYIFHNPHL